MKTKTIHLALMMALTTILVLVIYPRGVVDSSATDVATHLELSSPTTTPETLLHNAPASVGIDNCRFGVATDPVTVNKVASFGAGLYLNFSANSPPPPENGAEFAHILRVSQDKTSTGDYLPTYTVSPALTNSGLGSLVQANPGALWLVGNEPDRGPDPGSIVGGQDDTFPEIYAQAYHDVYYYIKSLDPTAQIAIAGLVEVTPGRLQYLDIVWDTYRSLYGHPIPVDVWNMHLYILAETQSNGSPNGIANVALGTDPALGKRSPGSNPAAECGLSAVYCIAEHDSMALFAEQVIAMRQWMKDHGQQNKPLLLSEFSSLFAPYYTYEGTIPFNDEFGNQFTVDRINTYMNATLDYLETAADPELGYPLDNNRLVQQWVWFSMYTTEVGWGSNLLNTNQSRTQLGNTYASRIQSASYTNNLLVGATQSQPQAFSDGVADVILSAEIYNNGSKPVEESFTVTFYKNAGMTQQIGSAIVIDNPLRGCARTHVTTTVAYEDLLPGVYQYWVKIQPISGETSTSDNVGTGVFVLSESPVFLPAIHR